MLDYLDWRGDLPMDRVPFCEADQLVLCNLCYTPFEGVVSGGFEERVPLAKAVGAVLAAVDEGRMPYPWHLKEDQQLLRALVACPRFADLPLMGYRSVFNAALQEQFAALTVLLPDGSAAACYRGTDFSLVGWKENFNLAFAQAVPAQIDAMNYLCELSEHVRGALRTLGHSKGGNLAVYAAAFCPPDVQLRLLTIRSFDGPGFNEMVVKNEGFARLGDRVLTVLPQSSVVGMLLEHEEDFQIAQSDSVGVFQHDLYRWQVRRGGVIPLAERTNSSRYVDATLKKWVADMTPELREKMIDGAYSLLEASGAHTFADLKAGRNAVAVLKAMSDMDPETRAALGEAMRLLGGAMRAALPELTGSTNVSVQALMDWLRGVMEKLWPQKN